jgi:hypothetical protein
MLLELELLIRVVMVEQAQQITPHLEVVVVVVVRQE